MREGWEIREFDTCIVKQKAPTKLLSSSYQEKGLYPIVSQEKDLISGYWDNPEDLFVHKKPVVVFGDHTMVVKYIDFNFVVGADGVKILEPKDFLSPKFFFYWVSSVHIKSRGYARHFRYLREAKVPVPSVPEQQRIVDILDQGFAKIGALKANAEKSLQAAKDLFQATLKKELEPKDGWETKQITEIASLKAGKFVSAQDIYDECGEEMYPCYGGNGLRGYVKTYNHEGRYNLIGRQGALCGNINIAEGKFHATEHAVVVSPIIPVVFKFLYYSLCNANINQYATGAAQPGISVKNINERLFLGFPSLAEQAKVADRIDLIKQQTESLQENYQKTLTLCDDLKQSLLRKAFSGEL